MSNFVIWWRCKGLVPAPPNLTASLPEAHRLTLELHDCAIRGEHAALKVISLPYGAALGALIFLGVALSLAAWLTGFNIVRLPRRPSVTRPMGSINLYVSMQPIAVAGIAADDHNLIVSAQARPLKLKNPNAGANAIAALSCPLMAAGVQGALNSEALFIDCSDS